MLRAEFESVFFLGNSDDRSQVKIGGTGNITVT